MLPNEYYPAFPEYEVGGATEAVERKCAGSVLTRFTAFYCYHLHRALSLE